MVAPGCRIHSDCQTVVDGFAKGPNSKDNHRSIHAQLCRDVSSRATNKRSHVVTIKAHATQEDVEKGRICGELKIANEFVDTCAKLGARKHATSEQAARDAACQDSMISKVAILLAKIVFPPSATATRKRFPKQRKTVVSRRPYSINKLLARCGTHSAATVGFL